MDRAVTEDSLFLAWCAGFFDGEGSVSIVIKSPRRHATSAQFMPIVTISQNDQTTLYEIKARFGGCVCGPYGQKKLMHQWKAERKTAIEFLRLVRTYLRVKMHVADVAIEFQARKEEVGPRNQWTTVTTIDEWKAFKERIQTLNRARGGAAANQDRKRSPDRYPKGESQCIR